MAGELKWSLIFVLSLALASSHHGHAYDGSLKKRICNGETYKRHETVFDPPYEYECAVNTAMDAILKYTKQNPSYTYFYGGRCLRDGILYVYAYGFCRKELSSNDCGDCITSAKDSLFHECTHSVGAQVELQDCQIRYESYSFSGDY